MNNNIVNYIKLLTNNSKVKKMLIETVGKILLKQDNNEFFIKKNEDKIIHIRDWITSIVENNEEWKEPRVLTLEALNNAANKYFEKKNNKIQTIELDENQEKLIADLDDYYIVQMLTPQALDNESKVMQHCIGYGGYDENLKDDEYQYLSLRDKYNKAHVTLEIWCKKIEQLQGKQNKIPDFKYLEKLIPWLMNNNYRIDLNKYEILFNKNDEKFYSVYELPENCRIHGNFNLEVYDRKIEKIPENLIIDGDFILTPKNLEIPNNLIVNGDICICDLRIKQNMLEELFNKGKNTTVFEIILWIYKNIEKINLSYYELVLNENDNKIYSMDNMPDNCIINDNFPGSSYADEILFNLPNNLIVNGNMDLYCSEIEKLPKNLIVNGSLMLDKTQKLKTIPEDIIIKGDLRLDRSAIETLPNNLIVHGELNLSNCKKIKKLPDNLIVNGDLNLCYAGVEEIPEDLKVQNKLNICGLNLKKLPDNLSCNTIMIHEYQENLIKETMNFQYVIINDCQKKTKEEFFKFDNKKILKQLKYIISKKINMK